MHVRFSCTPQGLVTPVSNVKPRVYFLTFNTHNFSVKMIFSTM